MRASRRLFSQWFAPLFQASPKEERVQALQMLSLHGLITARPKILRALADRSSSVEIRLTWLKEALLLPEEDILVSLLRTLLEQQAFSLWRQLFQEYAHLRESKGYGRIYWLKSPSVCTEIDIKNIEAKLQRQFSIPALVYPIVDVGLKAGLRIESLDGWVVDTSVVGRLQRLALSLAT